MIRSVQHTSCLLAVVISDFSDVIVVLSAAGAGAVFVVIGKQ